MKYKFSLILFFTLSLHSFSQLPGCEIWLADMKDTLGKFTIGKPKNISNNKGYDSQPMFSIDLQSIYFTSARGGIQTDIYNYAIKTNKVTAFCNTPESEYSPTYTPDKKFISVVRVEKDSAQRIWKFPSTGGDPILVTPKIDSIGYHCWISKDTLLTFILTQPFTLQLVDLITQTATVVDDSIGKSLSRMSFIRSAGGIYIKSDAKGNHLYITPLKKIKKDEFERDKVITMPIGAEYFAFNNNIFFCASGSKIFKYELYTDEKWIEIADMTKYGLKKISRLAVSRDFKKIAIVNAEE